MQVNKLFVYNCNCEFDENIFKYNIYYRPDLDLLGTWKVANKLTQRFQLLQKSAAQIITHTKSTEHVPPLLNQLQCPSITTDLLDFTS